jgi:hypothetical protein
VSRTFNPGDFLIFQVESGFGLLRVLGVDEGDDRTVWHLLAYEEFFPSIEAAEAALAQPGSLHVNVPHMALTGRAFERTPAALLGNRPLTEEETKALTDWIENGDSEVSDRSALQMLGIR